MEVPESVRIGLANIHPDLHARMNNRAKVVGERSFDVNGNPREISYDPRWELWHKDEGGNLYKVATLEGPDGGFLPLGEWVFEFMARINPANYDGDMNKMIEALVDTPNNNVERLGQKTYEELVDYLADLCWSEKSRGSRVVMPRTISIPSPVVN